MSVKLQAGVHLLSIEMVVYFLQMWVKSMWILLFVAIAYSNSFFSVVLVSGLTYKILVLACRNSKKCVITLEQLFPCCCIAVTGQQRHLMRCQGEIGGGGSQIAYRFSWCVVLWGFFWLVWWLVFFSSQICYSLNFSYFLLHAVKPSIDVQTLSQLSPLAVMWQVGLGSGMCRVLPKILLEWVLNYYGD